jgi:hypothetical protein
LRAVPLAAVIPSHGPAVAGCMGRVRVRERSGGVNQGGARAARAAGQTQRRPRAWPLAMPAVHAARAGGWGMRGWAEGWARQRICPSRKP